MCITHPADLSNARLLFAAPFTRQGGTWVHPRLESFGLDNRDRAVPALTKEPRRGVQTLNYRTCSEYVIRSSPAEKRGHLRVSRLTFSGRYRMMIESFRLTPRTFVIVSHYGSAYGNLFGGYLRIVAWTYDLRKSELPEYVGGQGCSSVLMVLLLNYRRRRLSSRPNQDQIKYSSS